MRQMAVDDTVIRIIVCFDWNLIPRQSPLESTEIDYQWGMIPRDFGIK